MPCMTLRECSTNPVFVRADFLPRLSEIILLLNAAECSGILYPVFRDYLCSQIQALTDCRISTPMPVTSPTIMALATLSNIIYQAGRQMYEDCPAPPSKLWQSAQDIRL